MKEWFWIVVVFLVSLTAQAEHLDSNARAEAPAAKSNPALEKLGIEQVAANVSGDTLIYTSALQECLSRGMTLPTAADLEAIVPHLPALLGKSFDTTKGWLWSSTANEDATYPHWMYSFDVKGLALAQHRTGGRYVCVKYKADRVPGEQGPIVALTNELQKRYAQVKETKRRFFHTHEGDTINEFVQKGAYPNLGSDVRNAVFNGWRNSLTPPPTDEKTASKHDDHGPGFLFDSQGRVYQSVGGSLITPKGNTLTGVGSFYFDEKGNSYSRIGGQLIKH